MGDKKKRTDGRAAYVTTPEKLVPSGANDLLKIMGDVYLSKTGGQEKIDVRKRIDAYLKLMNTNGSSAFLKALDEEKDYLPLQAAQGATLQPFAYLPVEIPSTLN